MSALGDRLRDERAKQDIRLRAAADAMGVSIAYLSAIENGERLPKAGMKFQKILDYYNLDKSEMNDLVEQDKFIVLMEDRPEVSKKLKVAKSIIWNDLSDENLDALDEYINKLVDSHGSASIHR